MKKRVMVGMSGGVDSSVAALILKEQGFEVAGATMNFSHDKTCDSAARQCCSPQSVTDAEKVCSVLDIPHYVFDFADHLKNKVIDNFIAEYKKGRTPNPCVKCNQYLKFKYLFKKAKDLNYNYIATGHYAKIEEDNGFHLCSAEDAAKDQTYFLWGIDKELLKNIIFPISHLTKSKLREIAHKALLPVANKGESQDICFVPEGTYKEFMKSFGLEFKQGNILDTEGKILGQHQGIENYTIGQRRGLKIALGSPRYVVDINIKNNTVTIGTKEDLKVLMIKVTDTNILEPIRDIEYRVKIRSNMKAVPCVVETENKDLVIKFNEPVYGVSPGQSAVLYDEKVVVAGGIINERL